MSVNFTTWFHFPASFPLLGALKGTVTELSGLLKVALIDHWIIWFVLEGSVQGGKK